MKETAESPVAESVKLCIELDEEMQNDWESVKEDLESIFRDFKGVCTPIKDTTVFQGLLYCYLHDIDSLPMYFASSVVESKD